MLFVTSYISNGIAALSALCDTKGTVNTRERFEIYISGGGGNSFLKRSGMPVRKFELN